MIQSDANLMTYSYTRMQKMLSTTIVVVFNEDIAEFAFELFVELILVFARKSRAQLLKITGVSRSHEIGPRPRSKRK